MNDDQQDSDFSAANQDDSDVATLPTAESNGADLESDVNHPAQDSDGRVGVVDADQAGSAAVLDHGEATERSLAAIQDALAQEQSSGATRHSESEAWPLAVDLLRHRQLELDEREQSVAQAALALRRAQRELALAQEEYSFDQEQYVVARRRLEDLRQQLEAERQRVSDEHAEIRHALEAEEQAKRMVEAMSAAGQSQLQEQFQEQLQAAATEATAMRNESAQLQKLCDTRDEELRLVRDHLQTITAEIEMLRNQHDQLSQELAVKDQDSARESSPKEHVADEDLEERLDMAIDEIHTLKHHNTELEEKLAKARAAQPIAAGHEGNGRMDWESQKRRMLESLNADFDQDDPDATTDRLSIEGTIRITDDLLGQKEREIAELRKLLSEQASLPEPAPGMSAEVAELLDSDEVIRQERQRLEELQAEWREKLRMAEIDLSVERAKLARQHAEISEKLDVYQFQQLRQETDDARPNAGKSSKPSRGKWLARLGLKDAEAS